MTEQVFSAGQVLTAAEMNALSAQAYSAMTPMLFQAGRFYTANRIVTVGWSSTVSLTQLTTGNPIYVPNAITLQTLSVETTGTISGTLHSRMALYTDGGGYPLAPVAGTDTGDLTQTTAGVLTSGTLGVALAPGWYWPVWESSGLAGAQISVASSARPSMNTQTGTSNAGNTLGANIHTLLATHTYGAALPNPWVTSAESATEYMPTIALGF